MSTPLETWTNETSPRVLISRMTGPANLRQWRLAACALYRFHATLPPFFHALLAARTRRNRWAVRAVERAADRGRLSEKLTWLTEAETRSSQRLLGLLPSQDSGDYEQLVRAEREGVVLYPSVTEALWALTSFEDAGPERCAVLRDVLPPPGVSPLPLGKCPRCNGEGERIDRRARTTYAGSVFTAPTAFFPDCKFCRGSGRAPVAPGWYPRPTHALVRGVYAAGRETGTLPAEGTLAIADALEEEGCPAQEFTAHLRTPGVHYVGCWTVNWLLTLRLSFPRHSPF